MVPEMEQNENLVINCSPTYIKLGWRFWVCCNNLGLDAKISYFGKHTFFKQAYSWADFLKYMGGIPVDKNNPGSGLVREAIKNMEKLKGSLNSNGSRGNKSKN